MCLCFCYYVCVWNGLMPLLVECGFNDRSVGRGLRFNTTTTCSLPSLPLFPYAQSYYHCACFSERVCVYKSDFLSSLIVIIIVTLYHHHKVQVCCRLSLGQLQHEQETTRWCCFLFTHVCITMRILNVSI